MQRDKSSFECNVAAAQAGMEVIMIRVFLSIILTACCCHAQGKGKEIETPLTNAVPEKIQKPQEKKVEHEPNKLTVKTRDKGSEKESDYKTVKEYPLMFKNNRKARKETK
jgi:hypothetical protein